MLKPAENWSRGNGRLLVIVATMWVNYGPEVTEDAVSALAAQGFAGSNVDLALASSHGLGRDVRKIGAYEMVLPEQPVAVLAGATPPRICRDAEVDLNSHGTAGQVVLVHLHAMVSVSERRRWEATVLRASSSAGHPACATLLRAGMPPQCPRRWLGAPSTALPGPNPLAPTPAHRRPFADTVL